MAARCSWTRRGTWPVQRVCITGTATRTTTNHLSNLVVLEEAEAFRQGLALHPSMLRRRWGGDARPGMLLHVCP